MNKKSLKENSHSNKLDNINKSTPTINNVKRRSGAKIMANLILLLGSLGFIMLLAVINGSFGFVCAMGVTVFGAIGIAKIIGETITMS